MTNEHNAIYTLNKNDDILEPQLSSSEPSPQWSIPSHVSCSGMHLWLSWHWNSSGGHVTPIPTSSNHIYPANHINIQPATFLCMYALTSFV